MYLGTWLVGTFVPGFNTNALSPARPDRETSPMIRHFSASRFIICSFHRRFVSCMSVSFPTVQLPQLSGQEQTFKINCLASGSYSLCLSRGPLMPLSQVSSEFTEQTREI